MAHINLLPWRENLRKKRQREFGVLIAGMAVITCLLMLLSHIHIETRIKDQLARNNFLDNEIIAVDSKIREIKDLESTKDKLLARMEIIQQLQSSRPEIVHLFEELVVTVPEGAYLTSVVQSGRTVTIDGLAQSNARVSSYMRNIEASPWLEKPNLMVIGSKDKNAGMGLNHFRLNAKQTNNIEGAGK